MMNNAPFFEKQPTDGITELFCLIGSKAWFALGYDKQNKTANGEEWHLLCQSTGKNTKQLPLVIGEKQLKEIHQLNITKTQKMIRFCVYGSISEEQKTALLLNIAQNSPLETVRFADNLGDITEDLSGYIQRLRQDKETQKIAELVSKNLVDNAPKKVPYIDYRDDENGEGLFYIVPIVDKESGEIINEKAKWICDNLELKGQGKDPQGEYYYLFSWQNADEQAPRLEAVHLADFGTETGWKQLKANGLKMTTGQGLTANLAQHFHAISKTVPQNWKITKLTGWQNGAYLLPNGEMIGEPHSPIYFTEKSGASLGYTTSGTLESWQREIADNLKGNHSMMLGVAVALSAPMLAILGRESFGVHLFADSSKGKSTTLNIANSIYGNPDKIRLSWSTTAVGIKNEATARNDGFITLDEIGQAKDAKNLEAIAYDLFNETGKIQGKKEGGNREVNRWKVTAFSTGEKDLETQLRLQGAKVHAGQLVRLLNVPLEEAKHLHQFSSNKAHADHLNEKVQEHFGVIGREWIKFLAENGELVRSTYKAIKTKWLDLTSNMSGQVQRVACDRFAILETALQLAKHLTQWAEGENAQAILKNFLNWKEDFGEKNREETTIIETLLDWINENEASFIEYPFDPNQRTPNKIAGFRVLGDEARKEEEHFLIYPKSFKEILTNYPIKMACEILANSGVLVKPEKPERNYEYMFIISQKIAGKKKIRAYKIKPLLQNENDN
ncbi:DUF927 domain-containing protein [Glaesserella parasuis]|uniref:DUF927 domain-containing protein n=2 Tax=Glaesserella parasuis TaxID=738 RepID=UPI000992886F|nr:DUF927 domain-containing protein [Glaesserella parasuis]MCT8526260.1 DUF927 domain-containing protein [Glaesserella parasuis]MCT8528430.1 DUF927 domain-containing protein [Glaesserella parasuis]MCT8530897.1 DUF927 domain-containing protein [Glaesserella parasuis]MCT8533085.1 DUF927 domain-containing protein [Glaesserella parasuis]MCT8537181.1 DUF927 domain-containing protein [Glaesserella parasuis]